LPAAGVSGGVRPPPAASPRVQFFQKAMHVYSEMAALTTVGTRRQRDFFKERVEEIGPLERYCRYEMGEAEDVVGMLVDGQVRTAARCRAWARLAHAGRRGGGGRSATCARGTSCLYLRVRCCMPRTRVGASVALCAPVPPRAPHPAYRVCFCVHPAVGSCTHSPVPPPSYHPTRPCPRCVRCARCCLLRGLPQATKLLKEKLEAVLAEAHKRVDTETFTDVHWRGSVFAVKSERLRTAFTTAAEKAKQLR
jgi:hypothetical protein